MSQCVNAFQSIHRQFDSVLSEGNPSVTEECSNMITSWWKACCHYFVDRPCHNKLGMLSLKCDISQRTFLPLRSLQITSKQSNRIFRQKSNRPCRYPIACLEIDSYFCKETRMWYCYRYLLLQVTGVVKRNWHVGCVINGLIYSCVMYTYEWLWMQHSTSCTVLWCWKRNIPVDPCHYHGCWCPGFLHHKPSSTKILPV